MEGYSCAAPTIQPEAFVAPRSLQLKAGYRPKNVMDFIARQHVVL